MQLDWNDLWCAFALYLVLEGLMPFASPGAVKRVFATLATLPESTLRAVGFASMVAGCVLLYLIRA